MPRLFPRIDVRKVIAGSTVNIDVLFWTVEGTPLTGQGSVSLVIRRGSDGFYWNGLTFIAGYRVVLMTERGSNPHQEGVYRYDFNVPKPAIPREHTYDWSVERVAPDNRTYLQKGRINAVKTGIADISDGGPLGIDFALTGARSMNSLGEIDLHRSDGMYQVLMGTCVPRVIASFTVNLTGALVWDLRPYQNILVEDCCMKYWRLVQVCELPEGTLVWALGLIDCDGKIFGLQDEFRARQTYDGCMELQVGCVTQDGGIEWPAFP